MTMKCDSRMILLALSLLALYVHGSSPPTYHNPDLAILQRAIGEADSRLDVMDFRLDSLDELSATLNTVDDAYILVQNLEEGSEMVSIDIIAPLEVNVIDANTNLADAQVVASESLAVLNRVNTCVLRAEQRANVLRKINTEQSAAIAKLATEQIEINTGLNQKLSELGDKALGEFILLRDEYSSFNFFLEQRKCFSSMLTVNLTDGEGNEAIPEILAAFNAPLPIVYCAISGIFSTIDEDKREYGSYGYGHHTSKRQRTGFSVDCYFDSEHDEYHVQVTDQSQSELGLNKALSVTVQYYACSLVGLYEEGVPSN